VDELQAQEGSPKLEIIGSNPRRLGSTQASADYTQLNNRLVINLRERRYFSLLFLINAGVQVDDIRQG
jgi:hypothetical protein